MNEAFEAGVVDGMEKSASLYNGARDLVSGGAKRIGYIAKPISGAVKNVANKATSYIGGAANKATAPLQNFIASRRAAKAIGVPRVDVARHLNQGKLTQQSFEALEKTKMKPAHIEQIAARNVANRAATHDAAQKALAKSQYHQSVGDTSLKASLRGNLATAKKVGIGAAVALPAIAVGSAAFGAGASHANQPGPNDYVYNPGY